MAPDHQAEIKSPVNPEGPEERLDEITGLCLSGGGYRAMLFHVGAIWRLNELRYLPKLDRISSVSGGSIAAAVLGANWGKLDFGADDIALNLDVQFVEPVRAMADRTIDGGAVLGGIFTRGTVSEKVADAYRKHLVGNTRLDQLPDRPRFVFNATNVQTGNLWRFSKPYMGDWEVGVIDNPDVELAIAVAASAAFPPVLSPLQLDVDRDKFTKPDKLYKEPYNARVVLTDGGVYDNLGLETVWKRCKKVLVSDAGGHMPPDPEPKRDWARHAVRIGAIVDNQVRDLRKGQAIAGYLRGDRTGAYWGIRSHIADFPTPNGSLHCPSNVTENLANTGTRLRLIENRLQERLINWGYAICDAAIRSWVERGDAPPVDFPFPQAGVG